jgi:hypothetical protein
MSIRYRRGQGRDMPCAGAGEILSAELSRSWGLVVLPTHAF